MDLRLEWELVAGARGNENRATWARLELMADGKPVTRVLDPRSKSYRDHILVPVYPVAEWLVTHWWLLFHEPESPGRIGYERRHNLRFGREGYAFPDLRLSPVGDFVLLEWQPWEAAGGLTFVGSGAVKVERSYLEEVLSDWVEVVVARLEQQGITDTLLQDEWAAVQATADDERAFCIAAAQLGQDPYGLSDALAERIVQAGQTLPKQWLDEFFSAVGIEQLPDQLDYSLKTREAIQRNPLDLAGIGALREKTNKLDPKTTPWEQGYEVARWVRQFLALDKQPLASDEVLASALGVDALPVVEPGVAPPGRWVDAVVEAADAEDHGGFVMASRRPENRRFAFCRGLFEYLTDTGYPSALVTVARTERQKRNRAFAAELLAPSEWLREWCAGEFVGPEELGDAADVLGVSTEVVHRQLENHRIARLTD